MDRDKADLFARRLDEYIDRYAEDIGYARTELLLQRRAQDMRECHGDSDQARAIGFEELEGYDED